MCWVKEVMAVGVQGRRVLLHPTANHAVCAAGGVAEDMANTQEPDPKSVRVRSCAHLLVPARGREKRWTVWG